MRFRSAVLDRIRGKANPIGLPESRWGGGVYDELYVPETREEFVEAYVDRIWVQRCVELKAKAAAGVPVQAKVRGEWVDEHRILSLLDRPNPRDPASRFFETTTRWSQIVGDWFHEIVPARDGGIAELFPLRSHLVTVKKGAEGSGRPGGYLYRPNAEALAQPIEFGFLDPEYPEVEIAGKPVALAGRFPSPLDDFYGMPPLRGAKDDVVSEYYAVRYDHRFFRNSARPDVVIGFKGKLDSDQRTANREQWQQFKGVDRAHRAAILDGDPNVQILSQSQRDVEYLDGRRLSREGQCAAFGVPPVLVGILDRATYSNYAEAKTIFWTEEMLPLLDFLISWTNAILVPFFDDVEALRFNLDAVPALQEAKGWQDERAGENIARGLETPNEARKSTGREELEDVPEADQIHLPLSLVPMAGSTGAGDGGGDPPPAPIPEAEAPPEGGDQGGGDPAAAKSRRKSDATKWLKRRQDLLSRFSARAQTELATHFQAERDGVLEIVNGMEKSAELEAQLREYGWAEDALSLAQIVDAMQAAMVDESQKMTKVLLGPDAVTKAQADAATARTLRALADRPDGIGSVSGRVKQEVLEQVRLGIQYGITYRGIATGGVFDVGPAGDRAAEQVVLKGVEGVFSEYTTWQAERIARTESAVSFNRASSELMREAGISHVEIIDGVDDDDCAAANGEIWTLEEYESNPVAHPNCTRVGLPVIDE